MTEIYLWKIIVLVSVCFIWTISRVCRNFENDMVENDWGEWLPDVVFYPTFIIIRFFRYAIFPSLVGMAFFIIFM